MFVLQDQDPGQNTNNGIKYKLQLFYANGKCRESKLFAKLIRYLVSQKYIRQFEKYLMFQAWGRSRTSSSVWSTRPASRWWSMRAATISRTPRCKGSSSPTRSFAGRKTVWSLLRLFILAYGRRFWLAERGCRRRVSANQKRPHGKHEAGRRTEARSCCLEAATWLSLCLALAIWIALERDLNSADIKIFVNVKKIFQPLCWEEELRQ